MRRCHLHQEMSRELRSMKIFSKTTTTIIRITFQSREWCNKFQWWASFTVLTAWKPRPVCRLKRIRPWGSQREINWEHSSKDSKSSKIALPKINGKESIQNIGRAVMSKPCNELGVKYVAVFHSSSIVFIYSTNTKTVGDLSLLDLCIEYLTNTKWYPRVPDQCAIWLQIMQICFTKLVLGCDCSTSLYAVSSNTLQSW